MPAPARPRRGNRKIPRTGPAARTDPGSYDNSEIKALRGWPSPRWASPKRTRQSPCLAANVPAGPGTEAIAPPPSPQPRNRRPEIAGPSATAVPGQGAFPRRARLPARPRSAGSPLARRTTFAWSPTAPPAAHFGRLRATRARTGTRPKAASRGRRCCSATSGNEASRP